QDDAMIDSLLNLMFRCGHRRLTRPVTPVSKAGVPHGETYVVCLDCGKQFTYDLNEMRVGKAIDHSHDACVVPDAPVKPRSGKMKYAFLASLPLAVVIGAALRTSKKTGPTPVDPGNPDGTKPGDPH